MRSDPWMVVLRQVADSLANAQPTITLPDGSGSYVDIAYVRRQADRLIHIINQLDRAD